MDQANAGATSRLVDACGCDLDSTKTAFQSFHKNSKTWNLGLFIVLFSEFETNTNRRQIGTPFNHQTRPRQSEKIKGSCSSELKCGKDFSTGDPWEYPLVNVNKKLWNITIFNGKTHYKLPCSIAMLVYQRVCFALSPTSALISWVFLFCRERTGLFPYEFGYIPIVSLWNIPHIHGQPLVIHKTIILCCFWLPSGKLT